MSGKKGTPDVELVSLDDVRDVASREGDPEQQMLQRNSFARLKEIARRVVKSSAKKRRTKKHR